MGRPPIPGAPWLPVGSGDSSRFGGTVVVPSGRPTTNLPFLERVPDGSDTRRLARHADKLSQFVNSCLGKGQIVMTDQGEYEIRGGAIVSDRAPTSTDDRSIGAFQGCAWMDTTNEDMYFCLDASLGAARWKGPV